MQRATVVAVALSAYRREHGTFPSSLQDLLDGYLDAIPRDPYDDRPIRYVHKPDEDDFLLYCVSSNQIDDGGTAPSSPSAHGQPLKNDGDLLFKHSRGTHLYSEIQLEKITP